MSGLLLWGLLPWGSLPFALLVDRDHNESFPWAAVGGGVALVLLVGVAIWYRRHRLRQQHSHPALFQGLCEAHELDRPSQRLLLQVVRFYRLRQPARLFTEPQWLEPSTLSGALAARAAEIAALRTRLFAVAVSLPREESRSASARA